MDIKGEMRKVGEKLNYNQKKILGRGNFGSVVYFGHFLLPDKYEHQVAVKRFQWSSVKKDSIAHFDEQFIGLESKHLLRYFATEKTVEDFFYIVTELCTGTLEKLVKGQYMGPPIGDIDEREILFQVSKGLDYLHSKKIVHGDIKPSNILIYFPSANDGDGDSSTSVLFKLADYGIYSIIELDDTALFKKQKKSNSNLFGTMGWRAPELYDSDTFHLPADIFALGCIFGYTLSGGRHPFGDCTLEQSIQIMEKKGMKFTKNDLKLEFSDDAETAFDLIKSMLCMEPEERPQINKVLTSSFFSNQEQVKLPISETRKVQLMKESISYNPKKIIHQDFPRGHIVFSGFMSKNQVAINRITTNEIDIETMNRTASSLRYISNINPFVIQFLDIGSSPKSYKFIVTALWEATLEDYVEGLYKGPKFKDDREILMSVTNGLHYFHCEMKVAHGNIRPKTILICPSPESVAGKMTVKLADTITSACNQESELKRSMNKRMKFRWRGHAENLLPSEDILPLGCVFAYTLGIGGKNCFYDDIIAKIQTAKRKKFTNSEKLKDSGTILTLIQTMVNSDPEKRPTAAEILNHDFFLDCENSLEYVSLSLKGLRLLDESPKNPSISSTSNAEDKKDAKLEEELFNLCSLSQPTNLETDQLAQLAKNNASLDLNKSNHKGFTPLELICKNNRNLMDNNELNKLEAMNEETELIVQNVLPNALNDGEVESEMSVTAKITYFKNRPFKCELGYTDTSILYEGVFNGTIPVVLKQYQNVNEQILEEAKRDVETLSSKDNMHPNLIRYFGHMEDKYFTYIVIELCECSVADIIDPKKKEVARKKMPHITDILMNLSQKEILKQSSEAISFLHGRNKIHRNLHPENFLIACVDPINKDHFLVKLTDFQFTIDIKKQPKNTRPNTKDGWIAPESYLENYDELTIKYDSFLLGCYYFYVLSGGFHPFGERLTSQRTRIGCDHDPVYKEEWNGGPNWPCRTTPFHPFTFYQEETGWALAIIKDLLKYKAGDRKSVEEILESKYFVPESYIIYENPTSPRPGLCVIVSQEKHYNPVDDLDYVMDYCNVRYDGVGLDANELEKTFVKLGYDSLRLRNLRATELETLLTPEKLVKREGVRPFSEYASLIICYLGHGIKGSVCGVDGNLVSLNDIQYAFGDDRCPDLSGKPKIFIILACQGKKEQNILARNAASSSLATPAGFSGITYENLPILYDCIQLSSTIEEYVGYTYFGHGSVFIKSICSALANEYKDVNPSKSKERHKKDLTQLFTTYVTPSVGLSTGKIKQTPELRSSLSKMILFRSTEHPGNILKEYDGEKVDPQTFQINQKKCEDEGHKKKKRISEPDYSYLLRTILAEAPGEGEEVQQAIAWVILNRYNLNKTEWGGNISLEAVCCKGFRQDWATPLVGNNIVNDVPSSIYDSNKDPTFGATYFKKEGSSVSMTIPPDSMATIKIGNYHFFKDPPLPYTL